MQFIGVMRLANVGDRGKFNTLLTNNISFKWVENKTGICLGLNSINELNRKTKQRTCLQNERK